MNNTELRIGNYVWGVSDRIETVRMLGLKHICSWPPLLPWPEEPDLDMLMIPQEDISPIMITGDWLINLGFSPHRDVPSLYFKDDFRYSLDFKTLALLRPCSRAGEAQRVNCGGIFITDRIQCTHVHTLQNIYYHLTGTELLKHEEHTNKENPETKI